MTVDDGTAIPMEPFDWAKFLSDLAAKHGSSEKGVLLEGAFKSREYNFNITMGSYEGVLQKARTGGAKVSGIPTFLCLHLRLLAMCAGHPCMAVQG